MHESLVNRAQTCMFVPGKQKGHQRVPLLAVFALFDVVHGSVVTLPQLHGRLSTELSDEWHDVWNTRQWNAPMPSMDNTIVCGLFSVHSVPARVDQAFWYGAAAASTTSFVEGLRMSKSHTPCATFSNNFVSAMRFRLCSDMAFLQPCELRTVVVAQSLVESVLFDPGCSCGCFRDTL